MSDRYSSDALSEQLISRATGSKLIPGNSIKILKDAEENYPAWIDAIRNAKASVYFESYIIYEDEIGNRFAELLIS
ncbi:MAG: phosphatidylserine/phosphatidylglycerophosphate/cardiolipin synthase family protein, partial [Nitrospiria bacterium]